MTSAYSEFVGKRLKQANKKIQKVTSYKSIDNEDQRQAMAKLPTWNQLKDELTTLAEKFAEFDKNILKSQLGLFFSAINSLRSVPAEHMHLGLLRSLLEKILSFDEESLDLAVGLASRSEFIKFEGYSFSQIAEFCEESEKFVKQETVEEPVVAGLNGEAETVAVVEESPSAPARTISFINPSELTDDAASSDPVEVDPSSIIPENMASVQSMSWADYPGEQQQSTKSTSDETLTELPNIQPLEKEEALTEGEVTKDGEKKKRFRPRFRRNSRPRKERQEGEAEVAKESGSPAPIRRRAFTKKDGGILRADEPSGQDGQQRKESRPRTFRRGGNFKKDARPQQQQQDGTAITA